VLPAAEDKRAAVRDMFDKIAPRYDLLNRILTLRLDVTWRRRAVRELNLTPGSVVADIACGTGDFCGEITRLHCHAVGLDFSMGMLQAATVTSDAVSMVNADAFALPLQDRCLDAATCGFALRNLTSVPPLLDELSRTVRCGGRVALLEVDTPHNPVLRWGHSQYFRRVVPLIGALLSDRAAYRYLPESVAYLPSAAELHQMLADAGFSHVMHHRLSAGIAQLIIATRDT